MLAVEKLVGALSDGGTKRVSFTGVSPQGAVATEPEKVEIISDREILLGIVCHHRGGTKSFVPWERIVTIESIPKEEA